MNGGIVNSIVSIGLPIYNGEKFIEKRLESIFNQTFLDYEIIISDNCSSDNTEIICKSFSDKRMKYFRQEKNIGPLKNFKFVLDQAVGKYFVWAAVDDLWSDQFLEKNINILEKNKNYVGSISKVKRYGKEINLFLPTLKDNFYEQKYKKIRRFFRPFDMITLKGSYKQKVIQFLNNRSAIIIYSVFHTDVLKKIHFDKNMAAVDWMMILQILEYGDINVVEETLMDYYFGGISSKGLIHQFKHGDIPLIDIILPYYSFFRWMLNKFGLKFFISNFDKFFLMCVGGIISNFRELLR